MIGNPHLPPEVRKRLTEIAMKVIFDGTKGQRSCSDVENKILALCEAEGVPVTLSDVKQEYRDAAGYP